MRIISEKTDIYQHFRFYREKHKSPVNARLLYELAKKCGDELIRKSFRLLLIFAAPKQYSDLFRQDTLVAAWQFFVRDRATFPAIEQATPRFCQLQKAPDTIPPEIPSPGK